MSFRVALLALASLALASAVAFCASAGGGGKRAGVGSWGATGIAMEVTESGAQIEYDCARGSIGEPLVLDAEGRFDVKGRHIPERGGPVREGEESRGQPVRYMGQVTGDTMTLTVTPEGSGSPIGDYELAHGKSGRLRKCR